VIGVKRVVQVRLLPTPEQALSLAHTLHACNAAALWLSGQMHSNGVFRKFDVQKRFYAELREHIAAMPPLCVDRQEEPTLASVVCLWPVRLRWARRSQRSAQHRDTRRCALGRSHASRRSAYPGSQPGRQQRAYRHPGM
jgi:hypothetical protein